MTPRKERHIATNAQSEKQGQPAGQSRRTRPDTGRTYGHDCHRRRAVGADVAERRKANSASFLGGRRALRRRRLTSDTRTPTKSMPMRKTDRPRRSATPATNMVVSVMSMMAAKVENRRHC